MISRYAAMQLAEAFALDTRGVPGPEIDDFAYRLIIEFDLLGRPETPFDGEGMYTTFVGVVMGPRPGTDLPIWYTARLLF